jgi:UDP-glucuronate decarboxylase
MSKKILVTGAAGFLGTHLCLRLLNEGHKVVGLDSFYTGSQKNVDLLKQHKSFSFYKSDVMDVFPKENVERVYHLACPASPPHYQRNPIHTFMTSIMGSSNALDFAKANGARVLLASTSEIYGDPEVTPQNENYRGNVNTTGPRACYDEGKRAAEALFADHRRMHSTDIRIMRIFNTYGPYMDPKDGRVVSNFIMQALKGDDITIYGNGLQTRSFCYVDDLIDGMVKLMENAVDPVGPVNIGNPKEFTMLELADAVLRETGGKSKITYLPLPEDDPKQRCPDIALAAKVLGWTPHIALAEGLRKTIPWFKMNLEG